MWETREKLRFEAKGTLRWRRIPGLDGVLPNEGGVRGGLQCRKVAMGEVKQEVSREKIG